LAQTIIGDGSISWDDREDPAAVVQAQKLATTVGAPLDTERDDFANKFDGYF
jgi:hypothetical protein